VQVVSYPGISIPGIAVAPAVIGLSPGEAIAPGGIPAGVIDAPGVTTSRDGDVVGSPGGGIVVVLI